MRPGLEALRAETGSLFSEANDLKARWAHLEAAQGDAYKVRRPLSAAWCRADGGLYAAIRSFAAA